MTRLQISKSTRLFAVVCVTIFSCFQISATGEEGKQTSTNETKMKSSDEKLETATLGGGCFWCVEAVLEQIEGIHSVKSGYMGGKSKNPTYEEVCDKSRNTGHIEVVQISYDPSKVPFDLLLEAFWLVHDPTSKDQQGADKGIQYRSIIFHHDDLQKKAAETSIAKKNAEGKFSKEIVTEIRKVETFWDAEDYHQDYFAKNPGNGYCNALIPPKLFKLFRDARFKDRIKDQ
jgi:methionine-S-sulfoxide reductase